MKAILPAEYKSLWLTVLMETSCELAAEQTSGCKSCSLCSELKTCFVLNQKPSLVLFFSSGCISLWQRLQRPPPPPHFPTPNPHFPLSFLSISNPEGEGFFGWKQTTTNKRPKWGEQCGGRTSVWNNCEEQFQTDVCLDLALGSCPR